MSSKERYCARFLVNDESHLAEVTTLVAKAYSLADDEMTVPEQVMERLGV